MDWILTSTMYQLTDSHAHVTIISEKYKRQPLLLLVLLILTITFCHLLISSLFFFLQLILVAIV